VVAMVRELSIDFLHKKKGRIDESLEQEIEYSLAFALGHSKGIKGASLSEISRIGVPYWIVQVSNKDSIVLSPFHNGGNEFRLTKVSGLNEVIRKLRSDIDEPEDIPKVVPQLIENLRHLEPEAHQISYIESPSPFLSFSNLVTVLDPNQCPSTIKPLVDSRVALDTSKEFQELKESASLKVKKLHGVQKLISENVGSKIKTLKIMIETEKRRWDKRIADMTSSNKEEKENIEETRDRKLYELEEKHTMGLRAIVSDFSRKTDHLKTFFEKEIGRVDRSRVDIQQKPSDVTRSLRIVEQLNSSLLDDEAELERIIGDIRDEARSVETRFSEAEATHREKVEEVRKSGKLRIQSLDDKLASLKQERESTISEMERLLDETRNHLMNLEQEAESVVIRLENDLMEVEDFHFQSSSIESLAPLTRLDVVCYLAKYDKGADVLLTPCFIPDERFGLVLEHEPVSAELHNLLLQHFKIWDKENRSFEVELDRAAENGQVLHDSELRAMISDGFDRLQRMQLLEEDAKEHYLELLGQ
jgi:hypothetical protein